MTDSDTTSITTPDLSSDQFQRVSRLLHDYCGIFLQKGKEGLVKSRLIKRLHLLGMPTFKQYLSHVASTAGTTELTAMIDALTTNKTNFFREPQHFEFIKRRLVPESAANGQPPCIWSAGCSSGEEPYSLAITLIEGLPPAMAAKARVLATDISTRVIEIAREAIYSAESLRDVPLQLVRTHFTAEAESYRVHTRVRAAVRFAHLNLIRPWPMRGPFDAIFCRNVMIYFDRPTQQELVRRFVSILRPGGYLFVGHAESISAAGQGLRYVQPAVYLKN